MSKQNLQEFYRVFRTDLELQEQLAGISNPDEYAAKAVILGANQGFEFTVEDVKAALADPSTFIEESVDEELLELELQLVSGGNLGKTVSDILGGVCGDCKTNDVAP